MSDKKTVKKGKKSNPNLRLVKNGDITPKKEKTRREEKQEKIRFGRKKRLTIIGVVLAVIFILLLAAYEYILNNYTITTVYVDGNVHYTNEEIMEMVNKTGIGPQLGGTTTCIGVNIEWGATHIAGLPVAVTIMCHAARHKHVVL